MEFSVRVHVLTSVLSVLLGIITAIFAQDPDPCASNTVLHDNWRNINPASGPDPGTGHCDKTLPEGWYSFKLDNEDAKLPTQCVQDDSCGTGLPLRVELPGADDLELGVEHDAFLCGSYNVLGTLDCCVQRQPIKVKQCSSTRIVYRLKPPRACPMAFCAQKLSEKVADNRLAKHGDSPLSLGPLTSPAATPRAITAADTSTSDPEPVVPPTTGQTSDSVITRSLTADQGTGSSQPSPGSATPAPSSTTTPMHAVSTAAGTSPPSLSSSADRDDTSSPAPDVQPTNETDNVTEALLSLPPSSPSSSSSSSPSSSSSSLPPPSSSAAALSSSAAPADRFEDDDHNSTAWNGSIARSVSNGTESAEPGEGDQTAASTPSAPLSTATHAGTDVDRTGPVPATLASSPTGHPATTAAAAGIAGKTATARPAVVTTNPADLGPETSGAVCVVLRGEYAQERTLQWLKQYLLDASVHLTGTQGANVTDFHLTVQEAVLRHPLTCLEMNVTDPLTSVAFPAERVVEVLKDTNMSDALFRQTGLTLVAVHGASCLLQCLLAEAVQDDRSLFARNKPLFVTLIVVAVLGLLALLLLAFLLRWRQQGTWVLSSEQEDSEKGADDLAVDSPMTDSQIQLGEEKVGAAGAVGATTLPNGHRSSTPQDFLAADEDNGWVVPLDQAPDPPTFTSTAYLAVTDARPGDLAPKTEDTKL